MMTLGIQEKQAVVDSQNLQKTLSKLHEELQATPHMDAESRRLLQQVMRDVERFDTPQSGNSGSRQSRLEALAVQFETDHPTLAATLREFIDLLGQAGV